MRNVISVLFCVFVLSSCGRDNDSRRDIEPTPSTAIQSSDPSPNLPVSFDGAIKLDRDPSGAISLLQGKNLSQDLENHPRYQKLADNRLFGEMAVEFVHIYKTPFQLEDPKSELRVTRVQEDDLGFHQVRLAQNYKSLPVLYSEIIVHFDRDDHVYLVQGQYIQTPKSLNLEPKMTLDEVLQGVTGYGSVEPASTDSGPIILLLGDDPPRLVYKLKSQVSLADQSILLVDANNGEVIRKLPTIYNAN